MFYLTLIKSNWAFIFVTLFTVILFIIIFITSIYSTIAGWFNRTHIVISREKFVVRHGPLPWIENKELDTCDLKQFYVKKCSFLQRNIPTYEIHAITRNDKNIKLIGGIPSSEQALDIEQEVKKYLGIEATS